MIVNGVEWTQRIPGEWWESDRGVVAFGAFSDGRWTEAWFAFTDRDGEGPGTGPFDRAYLAMRHLSQNPVRS